MIIDRIKRKIAIRKRDRDWRERNPNNQTIPVNEFDHSLVTIGDNTYGGIELCNFNSGSRLKIGNYCSIAGGTVFILNADHPVNTVSTYPYKVMLLKEAEAEAVSRGDIIVEDDVWFGYGAKILSGVTIRQGSVISAGAVVTRSTEPYSIYGGVPAKLIKKRFSDEVIKILCTLDFSRLDKQLVRDHLDELYSEIDGLEPEEVRKRLEWFPKKGSE